MLPEVPAIADTYFRVSSRKGIVPVHQVGRVLPRRCVSFHPANAARAPGAGCPASATLPRTGHPLRVQDPPPIILRGHRRPRLRCRANRAAPVALLLPSPLVGVVVRRFVDAHGAFARTLQWRTKAAAAIRRSAARQRPVSASILPASAVHAADDTHRAEPRASVPVSGPANRRCRVASLRVLGNRPAPRG